MQKISHCRLCLSKNLKPFFDLGPQPFSHTLHSRPPGREEKRPLKLVWCQGCGLAQLDYTADPRALFSRYVWVTGTSQLAHDFAEVFARELLLRTVNPRHGYALEVASNDGTFLKPFLRHRLRVLGVDPAQNIAQEARAAGIPTVASFFGTALATRLLKKHGLARMALARNVLPHVADPRDFVAGLALMLEPEGTLAIEIQYAKNVLAELHYDTIYHQHLCYFTFKTLERLLNEFGLFVFDIAASPISGGALVVYAKKDKMKERPVVVDYRRAEARTGVNNFRTWQAFTRRVIRHRDAFRALLEKLAREGKRVVGYGAGDRGVTLLNFAGVTPRLMPVIADRNMFKQGRLAAGSLVRIESPEKVMALNPEVVVLVAWNFAEEVADYLKKEFAYKGLFLQPLPGKPRLWRAA